MVSEVDKTPTAQTSKAMTLPERIASRVVQNVCELPDYNSPENQPDLITCTVQQLERCVLRAFEVITECSALETRTDSLEDEARERYLKAALVGLVTHASTIDGMTRREIAEGLKAMFSQGAARPMGDGWEDNARYLLEHCPFAIRVREGGGPEDLLSSLVVTFQGMQHQIERTRQSVMPTGAESDGTLSTVAASAPCLADYLEHLAREMRGTLKDDNYVLFRITRPDALVIQQASQALSAEPTHFAFLSQDPQDKLPWPSIYAHREAAEKAPNRVSEIVPVRLELPRP